MTRGSIFASAAAVLLAGALIALPAAAQTFRGPGPDSGRAPAAGPTPGGSAPAARGGGGSRNTFTGGTYDNRGPAISGRPGGHGYRNHHGRRHYGGSAVFGGWGWGPSYYDDWAYPAYEDYERCYVRRVKVKGRWVNRRYCEY